ISCLCRTPLYGCLPGEYYEKPDHSQDNPKPLPTSANEVSKPACMVRSQALLLKALANAPLLARLPPQQSNLTPHSPWRRTWLACSTHVYVDMNLLGKSSRKENE